MIENGAEAAGVAQVVDAGLGAGDDPNDVARWMAENDYDGADIARVVAALRAARRPVASPAVPEERRPMPDIDLEVREGRTPTGV